MANAFTPTELFEIVEAYADFGDHITGTESDAQTTEWLTEHLVRLGADVDRDPFEFARWQGQTELCLADGSSVPHLPVYYSAVGEHHQVGELTVIELDRAAATSSQAITDALAAVDAAAGVLALGGPDDQPVACNRRPQLDDGPPAVVIPGNWASRVQAGARLQFEASLEPGRSANLVAQLGLALGPEVTVTTPLTGWTPCAGERGTGLAAALAIAADLAVDHRVRFVACSGHELEHAGLHHWLSNHRVEGHRVVHLGASVAATDADGLLGRSRLVATTARGARQERISQLARPANWTMPTGDDWIGEGATWRAHGAEVLSFLGSSHYFHTPADLVRNATNPEALKLATACALQATRHFLASSDTP